MRGRADGWRHPWQENRHLWLGALIGSLLLGTAGAQLTGTKRTARVSVAGTGGQSNGQSQDPAISADGRYIAFDSAANNLVPEDTNSTVDVFIRDRVAGTTELVSRSSGGNGAPGNWHSRFPAITQDGRFVAFASQANDLVPKDTSGVMNIFVRDRTTGTTELVSLSVDNTPAEGACVDPAISADGRFVAFTSDAENLVSGDTNHRPDIFLRDRVARTTEQISASPTGIPGNGYAVEASISAGGRYVVFFSDARNLVPGDTNDAADIFVRDRWTAATERVSLSSAGAEGNASSFHPAMSADGRYVAFVSNAHNLVAGDTNGAADVFVRDRIARTTERVSPDAPSAPDTSIGAPSCSVSADGRHVAFLVPDRAPGDTSGRWQIVVWDRGTGQTERVSVSSNDNPGNGNCRDLAMSEDGRAIAFVSEANNLVPGDTNGAADIFVRDRLGEAANLVVEPSSLAFGRIPSGTGQTRNLVLRNVGTAHLTGVVGTLAEPFTVVQGVGPFSRLPGEAHHVIVAFAPARASDVDGFRATLMITSSDPDRPTVEVPVSAENVGGDIGRLVLAPTPEQGLTLTLTERELVYGDCKKGSLLLQNVGMGPLTGRVEELRDPFAVVEGAGDFLLPPGESRTVVVQFCPPVGGLPRRYETTLGITNSGLGASRVPVPLRVALP